MINVITFNRHNPTRSAHETFKLKADVVYSAVLFGFVVAYGDVAVTGGTHT